MVKRPFLQLKRFYDWYMNNLIDTAIAIALTIIATGTYSNTAQAQTQNELLQQIEKYSQSNRQNQIEQVTNVNQLRDVSPTDWSYEAIRSLSDRYGCLSGFPDGTYRGNQPITRYEFAAGLNSCFEQIERLQKQVNLSEAIRTGSFSVISEDGSIISSFEGYDLTPERAFATMTGRLDELERRTVWLEENQFSTTTILNGDTTFGVTSVNGDLSVD